MVCCYGHMSTMYLRYFPIYVIEFFTKKYIAVSLKFSVWVKKIRYQDYIRTRIENRSIQKRSQVFQTNFFLIQKRNDQNSFQWWYVESRCSIRHLQACTGPNDGLDRHAAPDIKDHSAIEHSKLFLTRFSVTLLLADTYLCCHLYRICRQLAKGW